jgi:hypothetical protein
MTRVSISVDARPVSLAAGAGFVAPPDGDAFFARLSDRFSVVVSAALTFAGTDLDFPAMCDHVPIVAWSVSRRTNSRQTRVSAPRPRRVRPDTRHPN